MTTLNTIRSIVSTYNEVQVASDKEFALSILNVCNGKKTDATVLAAALFGTGIAMNVWTIKYLKKKGHKRSAKAFKTLTLAGLALSTPSYIRIFENIAKA